MASLSKFTLNPSLFNQGLYASILRLWLPTYPHPTSQVSQSDVKRWFTNSATLDDQVRALAGNAVSSIGPEHLTLPSFTSIEADRELYDELAAPFVAQLSRSSTGETLAEGMPADANAALALSIMLDQFPRNLLRGPAQSLVYTHYDRLARAVTSQICAWSRSRFVLQ